MSSRQGQALFSGGGSRSTNTSSRALVEFRYEINCLLLPISRGHGHGQEQESFHIFTAGLEKCQ